MSPASELVRSIAHCDATSGGTVALNGLPLPVTGFYVGGSVDSLIFDSVSVMNADEIAKFTQSAPSAYVGWWVDDETGKVYVDAVDWFANEYEAARVARKRHEIAIWDIARERELRLRYVEGE